jgi:hypothetical protein
VSKSLTIDTRSLHAALDSARRQRGVSWRAISRDTGIPTGSLIRTGAGKRLEARHLVAACRWLHTDVEQFAIPPRDIEDNAVVTVRTAGLSQHTIDALTILAELGNQIARNDTGTQE